MNYFNLYTKQLSSALDTIDHHELDKFNNVITNAAKFGQTILVCGNGGSAAIAEHLSCDHTKGVCTDTKLNPFVIPLASNVSLMTAIANDIGYSEVFAKQIEWYSDQHRAIVVVISSSGNSANIIRALECASSRGLPTLALVGFDGGAIVKNKLANSIVHVKVDNYGIVEDCHQIIMHAIAQNIRSQHCVNVDMKL